MEDIATIRSLARACRGSRVRVSLTIPLGCATSMSNGLLTIVLRSLWLLAAGRQPPVPQLHIRRFRDAQPMVKRQCLSLCRYVGQSRVNQGRALRAGVYSHARRDRKEESRRCPFIPTRQRERVPNAQVRLSVARTASGRKISRLQSGAAGDHVR
jgi:hypothetical protein